MFRAFGANIVPWPVCGDFCWGRDGVEYICMYSGYSAVVDRGVVLGLALALGLGLGLGLGVGLGLALGIRVRIRGRVRVRVSVRDSG